MARKAARLRSPLPAPTRKRQWGICANVSTARLQLVNKTLTSVFTKEPCVFLIAKCFSPALHAAFSEARVGVERRRLIMHLGSFPGIQILNLSVFKEGVHSHFSTCSFTSLMDLSGYEKKNFSLAYLCQRNQSISYKRWDKSVSHYVQGSSALTRADNGVSTWPPPSDGDKRIPSAEALGKLLRTIWLNLLTRRRPDTLC